MENKEKYFIVEYDVLGKKLKLAKITKNGNNFYDYCWGKLKEDPTKENKIEDYNDCVGKSVNIGECVDSILSLYSIEMTDEPINQKVCEIAKKKQEIEKKYGKFPNPFELYEKSGYRDEPAEWVVDNYFEKLDAQNIKYNNYIKNIIRTMAYDFNLRIRDNTQINDLESCYDYPEQIDDAISGLYFVLDEVIKSLKENDYLYLPIYEYGTHPDFKIFAQKIYEACGEKIVPRLSFELSKERYLAGDRTYTPKNLTCHPVLRIGKNEAWYDTDIADPNLNEHKAIIGDNTYTVENKTR